MSKEDDWGKIVLIAAIFLFVLFLFKIIFWISVLCVVIGIIWFLVDHESENAYIPVLMIVIGLIVAVISYGIGYGIESTSIGQDFKKAAEVVVDTDNKINEIPKNITEQLGKSLDPQE